MATEQETDPRLRWLKPLVIGLSALFVILLLALIVGMITGAPARKQAAGIPATSQGAGPVSPEALSLPRGARLLEGFGAADRVILRIQLADGSERLLSLDARSLAPLSSLTIQAER
ncbi:hypothetical protein [Ferrovibrio sp.]|uniref:hypothetical protein n=1 Tax=Ferrovibrio sp. TaxID=1917215 RepID=UPI0035B0839F